MIEIGANLWALRVMFGVMYWASTTGINTKGLKSAQGNDAQMVFKTQG